jgi:hypothetical protein
MCATKPTHPPSNKSPRFPIFFLPQTLETLPPPQPRCCSLAATHRRRPQPTPRPLHRTCIFEAVEAADLPVGRPGRRGSGGTARLAFAGRFTSRGSSCSSHTLPSRIPNRGEAAAAAGGDDFILRRRCRPTGRQPRESTRTLSRAAASAPPTALSSSSSPKVSTFSRLPSSPTCLVPSDFDSIFRRPPSCSGGVPVLVAPYSGGALRCCCGGVAGVHRSSCRRPLRPAAPWFHPPSEGNISIPA